MPKCSKCNKNQSKLNKGGLCKECFHNKINISLHNGNNYESLADSEVVNKSTDDDRYFTNIMKDFMMREKELNSDMINHLNEEVRYLKDELYHKNNLINKLVFEISSPNKNYDEVKSYRRHEHEVNNSLPLASGSSSVDVSINKGRKQSNDPETITSHSMHSRNNFLDWEPDDVLITDNKRRNVDNESVTSSIFHPPKLRSKKRREKSRPNVVINQYPQNDSQIYHHPKHVPGNGTFANMTKKGNKIALITDSICSRLKMKEFSSFLQNGYAYRKAFSGATSDEICHYSLHTLKKDCPDSVIINAGSNDLNNLGSDKISENIMRIVNTCHEHGVSNVYVSSITYRKGQEEKINALNNSLRFNQTSFGFTYVDNSNITQDDIWKDDIHLNNQGLTKIANNFISVINRNKHS